MRCVSLKSLAIGLAGGVALCLAADLAAAAEEAAPSPALPPELEARLAAEKEARKQCKVDICQAFATRAAEGAPLACDVTKTFLAHDISQKILSGRIGWPWGNAQCTTRIELDRAAIVRLVSEPEATVKLKAHELRCVVERNKGPEAKPSDSYVMKISIAPDVTFKNGRATDVHLNWSNIDAPLLAQGAIWSATTLDSAVNVMGGSAVTQINDFIYTRCKEGGVEVAQPK